ncbi:MAG: PqqD family protein [Dysgonamonadaceae bacterium]|nr:PqqD family protein [Dysgonamonadaceae bacterium]
MVKQLKEETFGGIYIAIYGLGIYFYAGFVWPFIEECHICKIIIITIEMKNDISEHMKLKDNLTIRKIGDEFMMVSESGSGLDYTRVISLNNSAAYLVQEVQHKEFTKEDWISLLIDKYDVDKERAESDVQILIDKLTKEGLFDE